MNKNAKRLLSLVLCLMLVLSVLPVAALAADTLRVYCQAPNSWSNCNAYWWGSASENPGWPGNPMSQDADGIWYYDIPADAPNVIFNNGSGSQTSDLTTPKDKNVMFVVATNTWAPYGKIEVETYDFYVAGVAALCGSDWNCADSNNGMKDTKGDGIYTKLYTGVAAGTYELKVTDGTWNNSWGAAGGSGNFKLEVLEDNSSVELRFDPSACLISYVLNGNEVTESVPDVAPGYYVAGDFNGWNCCDSNYIMTGDDNGIYYLDVVLTAGKHSLKVTDGTWDNSWGGTGEGGNYDVELAEDGTAHIIFDSVNFIVNVEGVLPPPAPEKLVINSVHVVGTAGLVGAEWDPTANEMTGKDGIYTVTFTGIYAGTYDFKFAANGAWDINWGTGAAVESGTVYDAWFKSTGNSTVTVPADNATVTLTLDLTAMDEFTGEGAKCSVTVEAEEVEDPTDAVYYVAGSFNDWNPGAEDYKMTGKDGIYSITLTLAAGSYEFKITDGTWDNSWGNNGGNFAFKLNADGKVIITFDANTQTVTVDGAAEPDPLPIESIHAVGQAGLVGADWDPTANQMTGENGIYTITFTGVAAGTYEFKFAANGQWAINWASGDLMVSGETYDAWFNAMGNSKVEIAEDNSTVTLTLDLTAMDAVTGAGAKCSVTVAAATVGGVNVGGKVTIGKSTNAGDITVELFNGSEVAYSVNGTKGSYTIEGVAAGTYTLKISKAGHVTRAYEITVGGEDLTQDGKICPIGDATGDGRVNAGDVAKLFAFIKGGAALADDYAMECANANGGKLNIGDVSRIYAHVTGKNPLF